MKTAKMDRRVSLETAASSTDAVGGATTTWTALATVWAERRNLKGKEGVEAAQRHAEAETVFTVRYSSTVAQLTAKDRLVDREENFDILAVTPIPGGRPEKVEILTKRRTA